MLVAALASAPSVLAHTVFTDYYVNGMPVGDGVAIRMSNDPEHSSAPIRGLGSSDMACNAGGTKGVSRVQPVKDGSVLTFEIRAWPSDPSKERLDPGHKGPCAVYLKKVSDATTDTAAGDGWFKIFDHGYDTATKRWCTDDIIANNGLLSVKLPDNLLGGDYLARPEILALHAAKDGDPQFYTGCAQIFLQSSGTLVPETTVSIPGYVDYNQPSTDFDIYNRPASEYVVPGPKIAKLTSRGVSKASANVQTTGLKPEGCIVENGNWCGKEVASYTTEKGCWASAEDCWAQSDKCYAAAPVTGAAGCKIWANKCEGINAECNAGNFNGPPNKGKILTPAKKTIDVGPVMSSQDGGYAPAPPKSSPSPSSDKPTKPAPQPEKPAPQPEKPAAPKPSVGDGYGPPPVISSPSPSKAPAPTPAQECPEGYKCVYVTDIAVVTTTVYVTPTPGPDGGYKKRAAVHPRRHMYRS